MISSLVTSKNCLKGGVAVLNDHARNSASLCCPLWVCRICYRLPVVTAGEHLYGKFFFPNTRNRLTRLLMIAKQCWNARDLCLIATKKEAPNKKSNASIHLLSDYLSRPENWNQILYSQLGYWEPKSHLLSTWKWPCAITVFISMNFFSGSLLSQQMV